ncbi:MAG: helix-turn-helix domain-containing protein [Acetobacteraceae bacterium]|nr:MAG: helix-turn-helix domain-containing protein [Acetobacteraceae bacterium]
MILTKIAYAWGFSDMTHFGRSFKDAYGVTPSDWRHHAWNSAGEEQY